MAEYTPPENPETSPGDAAAPNGPTDSASTNTQMDEVQRELDDVKNRLLRVAADYQNYVKRSGQSLQDARRQELTEVGRALLPVLDLFDKALAVDLEKTSAAALLEGMGLVRTEMNKRLAELGIEPLEVQVGEPFDPAKHEALMRQPMPKMEPNHIAMVLETGYTLGERVLRPAKVSVSA